MSEYYFAAASLPHLVFEMERFPTVEEFLTICRENVSEGDYAVIESASIDAGDPERTASSILNNWYTWERNLRNKLAVLRARRAGKDPEPYIRENPDLYIEERIAARALEEYSPLMAESILNRERWSYLDELERGHFFDTEKLIIYHLKLQILWRKQGFDKEMGTDRFNAIIQKFTDEGFDREESSNRE